IKIGTKYYHIANERVNWFTAAEKCRRMAGNLASFHNRKEFDAVKIYLTPRIDYWIDFTNFSNKLDFVSMVTGRTPLYISWIDGRPKTLRKDEHCGMVFHKEVKHEMKNEFCHTNWGYICEYP
ncbi:hypothetical protein KR222_010843, partial [Zaprionus bogoriensis]